MCFKNTFWTCDWIAKAQKKLQYTIPPSVFPFWNGREQYPMQELPKIFGLHSWHLGAWTLYFRVPAPGGYGLSICIQVAQRIVENKRVWLWISSIYVWACISSSTSYPYLELLSGSLEASSQWISAVRNSSGSSSVTPRPHHTRCHSYYNIPRQLSAHIHAYNKS